uniref:Uncharacterized protein n=1 Tax=Xiphophorus couchianus TaxID=32473 RepID=A0A3B5MSK0_9TELE
MHEQDAKKHERAFNRVYDSWKESAIKIRTKLKAFCSPEDLNSASHDIRDKHAAVQQHYEPIRRNQNMTPNVSVLLPECGSAPSHLESILNSFSSFYLIKKLPLYELLDKDFLQSAVYQGSVYGLSFRTRIDEDNCVALMPNGHLVFSLDKDTFETLGLEGRPSRSNRTSSRYGISYGSDSGSDSVQNWSFTCVYLCRGNGGPEGWQHGPWWAGLPEAPPGSDVTPEAADGLPDLASSSERVGLRPAAAAGPAAPSGGAEVSTHTHTQLTSPEHPVTHLSSRCHLQQAQTNSWASVTVHGFTDSPVSWDDDERDVLTGGHDLYNLLMFPDHTYRLHLAAGAQNTCPP